MPAPPADTDRDLGGACPNCGDATPGNYCPTCGQRRIERRVTLRRMLGEAVEDQLSLNAALPRTLKALLFHPGLLSREYVAGRIQRYIPPFRLYLVSSLLFFLVLSFATHIDEDDFIRLDVEDGDTPALPADSVAAADTLAAVADTAAVAAAALDSVQNTWLDQLQFRSRSALLDSTINRRIREFREMDPRTVLRDVLSETVRRAPTAMFLLLPVFALLLKLLYVRRKRYYVEHFVFGLHTHAFSFLLLTVTLLMPDVFDAALLLWTVVYFYVAMKRFYGQGWLKTLAKYAILSAVYGIVFSLAMLGTLLAAVLLA
jgi:hypothetical protein